MTAPADGVANILLVDDEPANLLALEAILEPLGQNLVRAYSGEEALGRLQQDNFAVVLLDVQLQGLSGFDTAQQIRGQPRSRHTPIIFLTAYESAAFDVAQAYALGAVDYLVKPLLPAILRAKVAALIELFQQTEQVRRLERRQAEHESLRRFQAIIEHAWDGIVLVGADGVIQYASPSAQRVGGFTPEELLGQDAFQFTHPEDADRIKALFAQLLQRPGQSLTATYRSRHQDGSWRWLEVTGTNLLAEPSVRAVVANYHDITELKQQAEQLAEADRRKDQFLSMLAHELRGPLAPLRNAVHLLSLKTLAEPELQRAKDIIARQVHHLARMVDDLLDVTRIVRGKIQLRRERLDLARLARTVAEDRRPALGQAGLTLDVQVPETPLWITGDGTRLAQVLNNLLDNAAKFTDRGGRVAIHLAADAAGRQAELTVHDTGIGIPAELLPQLFQAFAQADRSLERSRGGLGLGLAVVKGLVEQQGGTVRAASEGPGRGAAFTVRLPLEGEPAALADLPGPAEPASKRLRILVIEDNRDAADSLRLLLELLGHEVRVAHSGPEGVRAATAWRPNIVLSDIGLPGLDGWEVAKALRRQPALSRVRLIAITGYGSDEDKRRAREVGYDYLLTKPADPEAVLRLLAC